MSGKVRTETRLQLNRADLLEESIVVFAAGGQTERSQLAVWSEISAMEPQRAVALQPEGIDSVAIFRAGSKRIVSLRNPPELRDALSSSSGMYIDISGMPLQVWAPIIREALSASPWLRVIYAEPDEYRQHESPSSASLFHLSDRFHGVAALPGFARLSDIEDPSSSILVTFLGFEGMRPRQIAMSLDPAPDAVVPVVGLPGFEIDLPNHTISCNRDFLCETLSYPALRFCDASCPFRAYGVLRDIVTDYPNRHLYIAPTGTTPHALGAILFAMDHPGDAELIFDHPVPSVGRCRGISRVHVYHLK